MSSGDDVVIALSVADDRDGSSRGCATDDGRRCGDCGLSGWLLIFSGVLHLGFAPFAAAMPVRSYGRFLLGVAYGVNRFFYVLANPVAASPR